MTLKIKLAITIFLLLGSFVFALNHFASAVTSPTPMITPDTATLEKTLNNVCSNHGGVNCSILNPESSVVCNDGTIDTNSIIYAVPQCQKTIEARISQQSDLMASSGCFPPSELTCTTEQSLENLFVYLTKLGVANSELGKDNLTQCRKEINTYNNKNKDYKQCLADNKIGPIDLPTDRLVLPILKAAFCPLTYGNNSSYNMASDICVCDAGYFRSGDTCLEASQICQGIYGPGSSADKGNCIKPTPAPSTKIIITSPPIIPKNISIEKTFIRPQASKLPKVTPSSSRTVNPDNISEKPPRNIIRSFIGSLISEIKNMLKLF